MSEFSRYLLVECELSNFSDISDTEIMTATQLIEADVLMANDNSSLVYINTPFASMTYEDYLQLTWMNS